MPFLFIITFIPTVPSLIRLCFKNYFKSDESIITTALVGIIPTLTIEAFRHFN
ncbi:MAG: hypothetical protein IRD7MM_00825 [Candidatus Midichloria mitochondrii]